MLAGSSGTSAFAWFRLLRKPMYDGGGEKKAEYGLQVTYIFGDE